MKSLENSRDYIRPLEALGLMELLRIALVLGVLIIVWLKHRGI